MSIWRTGRKPERVLSYVTKKLPDAYPNPLVFEGKSKADRREMRRMLQPLMNSGFDASIDEHDNGITVLTVAITKAVTATGTNGKTWAFGAPMTRPFKQKIEPVEPWDR